MLTKSALQEVTVAVGRRTDAQRESLQSKGGDDPPNTCPLCSLLRKTLPTPEDESQVPRSTSFLI